MKTYELDVHCYDGWAWSKGHHELIPFAMAVVETTADIIKADTFRQRYARCVPVPGEANSGLVFCDGPGRGAFPVTEADVVRLVR
jgi:hypothetical protein